MRKRLLLTIALGVTFAAIAAGTAVSLTIDLGGGGGGALQTQVPGVLPQCADGSDNDGDGARDWPADPGCSGALDTSEYNAPPSGGGTGDTGGGGTTTTPTAPGGTTTTPTAPGGTTTQPGTVTENGGVGGPGGKKKKKKKRKKMRKPADRNPDGSPTDTNPTLTIAQFGAAPIGVPNFVIDQFEIPPFLLPIYQACGTQYSIPWQVLASINRHETAFGTNLNVSSAGAVGWMQFIPSSWRAYGTDANKDGRKDPYNPVDAICAAARYLRAAGGDKDLRRAIFAYNHADWYVDMVLQTANQYAKLPDDLIGSLGGLADNRFPVAADARYADDISEREAAKRAKTNRTTPGNAADVISDSPTRRGINIYSRVNAPVIAVNDGVIEEIGENKKLGKFIRLRDAFGNQYTYAQLGRVATVHPVPKKQALTSKDFELVGGKKADDSQLASTPAKDTSTAGPMNTEELRARLFALPQRPNNIDRADLSGQIDALLGERVPAYETFKTYFSGVFKFNAKTMELRPLKKGSKVTGGTVLGRIGEEEKGAPHVHFAIRPTGRGAPKIDPKPILDGWKLLEATDIYDAAGINALRQSDASIGQVLLMSKAALQQRVLADRRVQTYSCGRTDIQSGQIDRRVLAAIAYLAERGYRLTITSLKCGHSFLTTSGNVSAHSSGNAVDIAQVNGLPILGNQGKGSVTELVIRDLLKLQGTMRPAQVISLMELGPPTFAMGDHDDHIHVGYTPPYAAGEVGQQLARVLKPEQWERLIDRLGEIDNPNVPVKPSKFSTPANNSRASDAHLGE